MNSIRIFTKKTFGIDNNIIRLFIGISIVSLLILTYGFIKKEKQFPVQIKLKPINITGDTICHAGEFIAFTAISLDSTKKNFKVDWNFGDNSQKQEGLTVQHLYINEGKYIVTATINNSNEIIRQFTVVPAVGTKTNVIENGGEISGSDVTQVGKVESFFCNKIADSIYTWEIENHPEMGIKSGSTMAITQFTFDKGGAYNLMVTLDKDRLKRMYKLIEVIDINKPKIQNQIPDDEIKKLIANPPKPASGEPAEQPTDLVPPSTNPELDPANNAVTSKKFIKVSDEYFMELLQGLVNEQIQESQLLRYLCGGGSTPVKINGAAGYTFSSLCYGIKGKTVKKNFLKQRKNLKLTFLKLNRDQDKQQCVTSIEVNY